MGFLGQIANLISTPVMADLKVWRLPNTEWDPKNMEATVKHGGESVPVWGCLALSGVGELIFIAVQWTGLFTKTYFKKIF